MEVERSRLILNNVGKEDDHNGVGRLQLVQDITQLWYKGLFPPLKAPGVMWPRKTAGRMGRNIAAVTFIGQAREQPLLHKAPSRVLGSRRTGALDATRGYHARGSESGDYVEEPARVEHSERSYSSIPRHISCTISPIGKNARRWFRMSTCRQGGPEHHVRYTRREQELCAYRRTLEDNDSRRTGAGCGAWLQLEPGGS